MAYPTRSSSSLQTETHYCARCLAEAVASQNRCPNCRTPFTGAGRFDLMPGPAPSREFAFLFDGDQTSAPGVLP
jgi:predicted amidophosphoribosyltransferase